jgi:hypothetical protein
MPRGVSHPEGSGTGPARGSVRTTESASGRRRQPTEHQQSADPNHRPQTPRDRRPTAAWARPGAIRSRPSRERSLERFLPWIDPAEITNGVQRTSFIGATRSACGVS